MTGLSVLMYDSLSRKQLNNRKFEGYIALWQEVRGEYNMKTYAPMSYTFPKLHRNFKIDIALVLPKQHYVCLRCDTYLGAQRDLGMP